MPTSKSSTAPEHAIVAGADYPVRAVHEPRFRRSREWADKHIPKAMALVREMIAGKHPWPLFVFGDAGAGKTGLALMLVDWAKGEYFTQAEWVRTCREAEFGDLRTSVGYKLHLRDIRKGWEHAPVAVLDELGTRMTVSDHAYESVQWAVDARQGLPTVFVSNLDLGGLRKVFDDRIASRLSAGTVMQLSGDHRIKRT